MARRGKRKQWAAGVDTRLIGLYGERAAARALGVSMDTSVKPHGGDKRINLIGPNGAKIDVITRQPHGKTLPDLTLRTSEKERDDLALLLVVWFGPEWEPFVAGWRWERDLRAYGKVVTLTDGPCYTATINSLSAVHLLRMATGPSEISQQNSFL